jgi:hypothetical protein
MIAAIVLASLALAPSAADAQPGAARALIERSIAFHDPGGVWWSSARSISLRQPRDEGPEQRTTFALFPDAMRFEMQLADSAFGLMAHADADTCTIKLTGQDLEAARKRYEKMDCGRLRLYRSYYAYLFNLPMNLLDPAGTIEPAVIETTFAGRAVRAVRIGYGAGEPAWEFYFDPATAAIVGCRFARDPEWKTGEWIAFSDEVQTGGVRLPRERAWYYNENDKWLATDIIEFIAVNPASGATD